MDAEVANGAIPAWKVLVYCRQDNVTRFAGADVLLSPGVVFACCALRPGCIEEPSFAGCIYLLATAPRQADRFWTSAFSINQGQVFSCLISVSREDFSVLTCITQQTIFKYNVTLLV